MFREEIETSDGLLELLPMLFSSRTGALMVLGAYFDESESDSTGNPFTVAGYVFKPTPYKQFSRRWKAILRDAGVPAMHMVDLYHGKGYFEGISLPRRVALFRRVVDAITGFMMVGVSITVDQEEFKARAPKNFADKFGSIYATVCQICLQALGDWMGSHRKNDPIAYVFEDGHKYEHQASALLEATSASDVLKKRCRYHSVTFMPKTSAFGLQAADVLAWACTRDQALQDGRKVTPLFLQGLRELFADRKRYDTRTIRGDGLKAFLDGSARDPAVKPSSVYVGPQKRELK